MLRVGGRQEEDIPGRTRIENAVALLRVPWVLGQPPVAAPLHPEILRAGQDVEVVPRVERRRLQVGVADADREQLKLGTFVIDKIDRIGAQERHGWRRRDRGPRRESEEDGDDGNGSEEEGGVGSGLHGDPEYAGTGSQATCRGAPWGQTICDSGT